MIIRRPWNAGGNSFGWVVAVIVLLLAGGTALGVIHAEHLLWWLIAGLAAAVVIG